MRASDGTLFDDQTITVTVNDVAEAPVIGSNGGGPAASVSMNENQTGVRRRCDRSGNGPLSR